jgi:molecular chaperone DnaK (HSP70)
LGKAGWAIDLGNSHTRIAHWDEAAGKPRLLELPAVCREPGGHQPLAAPRLIPSAVEVIDNPGRLARWTDRPLISRHLLLGRRAFIGRVALERNQAQPRASFVSAFKPFLEREALRPLGRAGGLAVTAREAARLFLRELLAEVKRETGIRIRELAVTAPVEAFETYRAELLRIARRLGVRRLRFLDEPVAAALGYGLGLTRERKVLVVDFGAGTLDMAVVSLTPRRAAGGHADVLAKAGSAVGGNLVDRWLLEDLCRALGYPLDERPRDEEEAYWERMLLSEARRVKEELFFEPQSLFFYLTPSAYLRGPALPIPSENPWMEVARERLERVLDDHNLVGTLEHCLDSLFVAGGAVGEEDVEEVLMVGGSTLLPGVYSLFEGRFGRNRVRAWQPFQAVAYGACVFAAGRFGQSDHIVHDYALVTYHPRTHEKQHTVIVPRGTRVPTTPEYWKQLMVPTCSLGEPETVFKLVVCEIGDGAAEEAHYMWDEYGNLHAMGEGPAGKQEQVIVPLNEANPTLGTLNPPHSVRDRRPRLELSFGVNQERWLCATVLDLKTRRHLMKDRRVVRLM